MKSGNFNQQGGFMLGPDKPYQKPSDAYDNIIKRQASIASLDDDVKDTDEAKDKDGTTTKKEKRASVSFAGVDEQIEKPQEKKKMPAWLTSFADKVLGEAQAGLNIAEADDATNFLLGNRPPFDNDVEVSG
jgi:hypothetical protein